MIKLATVFSGIGAIEHALDRMNIPYEIAFACDNGDVNIFSKKIRNDFKTADIELKKLFKLVSNEPKFLAEYKKMKFKLNIEEDNLLSTYNLEFIKSVNDLLSFTINTLKNNSKRKELIKLQSELDESNKAYVFYRSIFCFYKVLNIFFKNNSLSQDSFNTNFNVTQDIDWNKVSEKLIFCYNFYENIEAKKIIHYNKDLCERVGMLFEKYEIKKTSEILDSIKDEEERKQYIDNLYKPYKERNKVLKSYLANYKIKEKNFHWNVSFLDGKPYANKVDLFVGGSPCQSFSLVGKQRGLEDTRGTLFYEFARLISEIQPKIFIYENVKAVLSNDDGKTWDVMKHVFNDLKYNFYPMTLNAKNYGIPQNRERLFVVGFHKSLKVEKEFTDPPTMILNKKMQDFLVDNVSGKYYLNKKGIDFVTSTKNIEKKYTQIDGEVQLCQKRNQQFNWHGDFIFVEENIDKEKTMKDLEKYFLSEKVVKYVLSSGTKGFYSRPKIDLDVARPLLTSMHKMHRAGIDNYVTTDGRIRKLTPRECLRLMGFCDTFKITVADTSMYQQAGNSIVVNVLIELMNAIIKSYPKLIEEEGGD